MHSKGEVNMCISVYLVWDFCVHGEQMRTGLEGQFKNSMAGKINNYNKLKYNLWCMARALLNLIRNLIAKHI